MRKNGYTLNDFLTIIVITFIVFSFIIPAILNIRKRGSKKDCVNNLRNIGTGLALYEQRYESYPEITGNACLLRLNEPTVGILSEKKSFLCPVRNSGTERDNYMGPNQPLSDIFEQDRPIAADAVGNHGNPPDANVLIMDCSVMPSPDDRTIFNGRIVFRNYLCL